MPPSGAAPDRRRTQRAGARQGEAAPREPRTLARRDEVRDDGRSAIGERRDRALDVLLEAAYAKSPG